MKTPLRDDRRGSCLDAIANLFRLTLQLCESGTYFRTIPDGSRLSESDTLRFFRFVVLIERCESDSY